MIEPRVAFVVWNPFQVVQFQNLATSYANSRYLIIAGPKTLEQFDMATLVDHTPAFEIIPPERVLEIDGAYDVIFFQSPFPKIEQFTRSRLVSIQYGLAKERHNYGEWRALADMNLMYGPYSAAFASHFAPSYAVGNIKFAGWDYEAARARRAEYEAVFGLNSARKTILYMPTYGDLGSFDDLVAPLAQLTTQFNVIIKMHHNNERNGKSWREVASRLGHKFLMSGDADQTALLSVADLVVSDFSGAIFDAVYAKIPVLLYQARADTVVGVQKFSHESLEFRRRDEIGYVCETSEDFQQSVEAAIEPGSDAIAATNKLRAELFIDSSQVDTIALARQKVDELLSGKIPPLTQPQLYVRETCQNYRTTLLTVRDLRAKLRKKPKR